MNADAIAVEVGGEAIPLQFTWGAFAHLRAVFGPGWYAAIDAAIDGGNPAAALALFEAASGRTAAWWAEQPVDEVQALVALRTALGLAIRGPHAPESDAEAPASEGEMIEIAARGWGGLGGDAEAFWRMTPWRTRLWSEGRIEARRRDMIEQAWVAAALTSCAAVGKLQPLPELLGDAPKKMTEAQIATALRLASRKKAAPNV